MIDYPNLTGLQFMIVNGDKEEFLEEADFMEISDEDYALLEDTDIEEFQDVVVNSAIDFDFGDSHLADMIAHEVMRAQQTVIRTVIENQKSKQR